MPGVISLSDFADSDDDEVQFIGQTETLNCQFCGIPLHKISPEERQKHYERHLTDLENPQQASSSKHSNSDRPSEFKPSSKISKIASGDKSSSLSKYVAPVMDKENVFWHPAKAEPPPPNFTPGFISVIKRALTKTHSRGQTTRAVLCHVGTTHISSEKWDIGWGCGYRNFLMACTALMNQQFQPLYFPLLEDPKRPPGIRNLQYWIEDAWADGFDREGASQLKNKLVGTKKWIGTAELYVAFSHRGVPSKLVDFPGSDRGPAAVTEWVINYFTPKEVGKPSNAFAAMKGASPIMISERMPLILQHSGHSRTIVGYELNKKGDPILLIFDPSCRPSKEVRQTALVAHSPTTMNAVSSEASPTILSMFSSRKRRKSNQSCEKDGYTHKRVRGGKEVSVKDNEVIVIESDEESNSNDNTPHEKRSCSLADLDPVQLLNFFRVNLNKLGKHDKYQILYFPLDPPLEKDERWSRRVVTSERVV